MYNNDMNKLTLLIDGNWLMMSRMPLFIKDFDTTQREEVRQQASTKLEMQMAKSIGVILNRFKNIDNMILIADGGSWRKKLAIPQILAAESTTYKGNRQQAIELDWSYIYKSFNNIFNRCNSMNITCSQYLDCEGDDLIWYWSRRLNSQGVNCIIWSSDNDLKQLVQYDNDNNTFTAWYNDKNGMYFSDNMQEPDLDPLDFFMAPPKRSMPVFESLISNSVKVSYVNPFDIVIDKIFQGDLGDNIKPIVRYNKNGRRYKLTKKEFNEIIRKFDITSISNLKKHQPDICNYIVDKFKKYNINYQDVDDMISYNINLVWLDECVIPETIVTSMNQAEYKNLQDIDYIRSNCKVLLNTDRTVEDIFNSI